MANVPDPVPGLYEHLRDADRWTNDMKAVEDRANKLIRWGAVGSLLLNVILGVVVAVAFPLKTVVPYMIVEDEHTGFWKVVKPLEQEAIAGNEARDKFLLRQYVQYRESYSIDFRDQFYDNMGYFSSKEEQARIAAFFDGSNPNSPWNVYNDTAHVKIFIKNISLLNKNVAQIRFSKLFFEGKADIPQVTNWIVTLNFHYVNADMPEELISINPYGFQVTEYRIDPESVDRNIK